MNMTEYYKRVKQITWSTWHTQV